MHTWRLFCRLTPETPNTLEEGGCKKGPYHTSIPPLVDGLPMVRQRERERESEIPGTSHHHPSLVSTPPLVDGLPDVSPFWEKGEALESPESAGPGGGACGVRGGGEGRPLLGARGGGAEESKVLAERWSHLLEIGLNRFKGLDHAP